MFETKRVPCCHYLVFYSSLQGKYMMISSLLDITKIKKMVETTNKNMWLVNAIDPTN